MVRTLQNLFHSVSRPGHFASDDTQKPVGQEAVDRVGRDEFCRRGGGEVSVRRT
jgi:hypothetical protein